jgi:hypothetical protein
VVGLAHGADPRWNKIWTYYNYPNGASPFVQLNLRTWAHHHPDMEVVLVNESNVFEHIPDMPKEFLRLPYAAAASDVIRAAAIYHHGGIYMDTDFVITGPLHSWLDKLNDNDIISYSDHGSTEDTKCTTQYSSNWHAGRKGNMWSTYWWNNLKSILTRKCDPGDFVSKVEKVCCHEVDAPEKVNNKCHIPWGQLEHLKVPHTWAKKHPACAHHIQQWPEEGPKMYCLKGAHSLTPQLHGELYWMPWDARHSKTRDGHLIVKTKTFNCTEPQNGKGDLDCIMYQNNRVVPTFFENFFNRPGYHLFFSTFVTWSVKTPEQVLHKSWLLSEIYRRSLGFKVKHEQQEQIVDPKGFDYRRNGGRGGR